MTIENGRLAVSNGNGKWYNKPIIIFVLNQVLTLMIVFVGMTFSNQQGSWKMEQRLADLMAWRLNADSIISRMDREGTNYSHLTLAAELATLQSNTSRIEKLELAQRKLDVIDEKISRIEADVKELKVRGTDRR